MKEHKHTTQRITTDFLVIMLVILAMTLLMIFITAVSASAQTQQTFSAADLDKMGGRMEAYEESSSGGAPLHLPVLKTRIAVDIQGDLANVLVEQTFANPTNAALNAVYLFPLNKDAAVHAMTMEVGEEKIIGQVKKSQEARETFEKARSEGRAAALLTQHRPNMFTQEIGNLMPGLPITTRIEYVQPLPKIDGEYELVLPLVVGPRFQPPVEQSQEASPPPHAPSQNVSGRWELENLPEYPEVIGLPLPESIDAKRVEINITLDAGIAVDRFYSDTHPLAITSPTPEKRIAMLSQGEVIDNRDFVLRYTPLVSAPTATILPYSDARGGVFSLLIEAPVLPAPEMISAREMVFVLDTSGSMNGAPLEACKQFMSFALKSLRPTDSFRIVNFGNLASEYSARPLPATPESVNSALEYVHRLSANGGTMMKLGVEQAFAPAIPQDALRIVVFLTDGYIGNEASVLELVNRKRGPARLYAIGVGAAPNRYLLEEMGAMGRGFTRFIDPTEDYVEAAAEMAEKLDAPVLTDIRINWGDLAVEGMTPATIPDLFAGQSLRIQGRYLTPGNREVVVSGRINGKQARMPLQLDFPAQSKDSGAKAIPLTWARSRIKDLMRAYITAGSASPTSPFKGIPLEKLKDMVTKLGLDYSLSTRWTSFVAVSERIYNETPETTPTRQVPVPMVKGVQSTAYQSAPYSGAAAPEPATAAALALLGAAGGFAGWRRRKKSCV